jgi:hypothetical protein
MEGRWKSINTDAIRKRICGFFLRISLTLSFCLLLPTSSCPGQNQNSGQIRGTVVDTAGAAIPGVSVDAVNTATGIHTTTLTGGTGVYDLPYIAAGEYSLTFTKDGFQKFDEKGITIHIQTVTINATLKVGSVATEVTVTGRPELLQTETSELSTVLPRESVSELPNVGRNWLTFTALIPGASPGKTSNTPPALGASASTGETVAINGGQEYQSSFLIDGGTLVSTFNPDLLSPPIESIAEVDITTSNFGAESGNGTSQFNVILKSGTNRFHGSLSEFVQNDIFNAAPRNWTPTPQKKPPVRWNEYGGTIGGPIDRDKLFFFFGFQANPSRSYTTALYSYPTAQVRQGNFSDGSFSAIFNPSTTTKSGNTFTRQLFPNNIIPPADLDPVAQNILKFIPQPNAINPSSPDYNNYYFSGASPISQYMYVFKVDGNIKPNNHAYVSGLVTPLSQTTPSPDCPIDCYNAHYYEYTTQLTDVWTLSTNKVNEFRVSMGRQAGLWRAESLGKGYPAQIGLPDLPANTFPIIKVTTGPALTVGSIAENAKLAEQQIVASDTFSWIAGRHTIKVGGEYDAWAVNLGWQTENAGTFNFSGIDTRDPNSTHPNASPGVGYADFLLGGTASWSVSNPIEYGNKLPTLQAFAQDYYKLRKNLTINYGMRYISQWGWKEEHNRFGTYVPSLTNPVTGNPGAIGFAGIQIPDRYQARASFYGPRVGFSYAPTPSSTFRGGFGLYAIPWDANDYTGGVGTGWTVQGSAQSTNNVTPVFQLASGPPEPVYPTAATRTPSLLNGQAVTYTLHKVPVSYTEQWQFGFQHQIGNYLMQLNYVGSRGVDTDFGSDVNQVLESQLGSGIRPNPTYQTITAQQYIGWSNYNSMQVTARRQFNNGFSFLVNYTWAKSLDTGTSGGGNGSGIDGYQNAYIPAANYAASSNDVRHTVNATELYLLPFGRNRRYANSNELADAVIGGWQVATIWQIHSGSSFTPLMANNLSGALSGSWYPNRVGTITVANPGMKEWFNVAAFTSPSPNTFGDSRRNILYGPRFADIDLSLAKVFAIPILGEGTSFQLKADSYDIFNHPNYGQPNSTIGSTGVGTISSSLTHRSLQLGGVFRF